MNFYQGPHLKRHGYLNKLAQLLYRQKARNKEKRVCAHESAFIYLISVNDEILPEHRDPDDLFYINEIFGRTMKGRAVSQHGNRRCTVFYIERRNLTGICIFLQAAAGRRMFFNLGDNGAMITVYRLSEIETLRNVFYSALQFTERHCLFKALNFLSFCLDYPIYDIACPHEFLPKVFNF